MESARCILCGSQEFQPKFQTFDYWLDSKETQAVYGKCLNCGLIYQNPRPDKSEINQYYPKTYHVFHPRNDPFTKRGLKKRCQKVTRYKQPGTLLDIGCAAGEFLQAMRDWFGWKVIGVEASGYASQIAQTRAQLDIFTGELLDANFGSNSFDVVTAWDVIEHLLNPNEILREIRRVLKPDGILILILPNQGSIDAQVFGKYWAGYDPPRHLYVFHPRAIRQLLENSGFTITHIDTEIGSYLNFVKSIQFWLTGASVPVKWREIVSAILSSVPFRIAFLPGVWIKNAINLGPEMVIIATPTFKNSQ